MNQQNFFLIIIGLALLAAMFSARSKQRKIYCTYRGANKQKLEKWIKMEANHVVFNDHQFDVVSSCVTLLEWKRGIHEFLPIWVPSLDFVHSSRFPIDPDTGEPCVLSPVAKKSMNNEQRMASFARGVNSQSNKKQSKILDYIPWIALVGLVLFAFYQYQMNQGFNKVLTDISGQLHAIVK